MLEKPEGQAYLAQQKEKKRRKEMLEKIDKEVPFEFKNDETKKIWQKRVKRDYNDFREMEVVNFARCWAKYMQTLIAEGKEVAEIADETSEYCNINRGFTKFSYEQSRNLLITCWKYGDLLK